MFSVSDGNGGSDFSNFTLAVSNVNDPPVVDDIPGQTINQAKAFSIFHLDNYVYI